MGKPVVGYSTLRAIGSAGGILVMWNTNTFQLISSSCGEFSITCILQMRDDNFSWTFTGIYGPQARGDKLQMLDELRRVRDGWGGPWCLGGDFNEILYVNERNTGVCPSSAMAEFREFINQRALVDLPLRGGDYTWSRSGVDSVASRLDRFLVMVDWEDFFLEMV